MAKRQKDNSDKMIGYMMYAVSVGMPMTNIPQIMQIFSTKVTTGLSLNSWVMYTIFGVVPLMYAISKNLKPLIISNVLWMFIDVTMIYGIMRYSPHLMPHDYGHLLVINNLGKFINQVGIFSLSVAFALLAADFISAEQKQVRRAKG